MTTCNTFAGLAVQCVKNCLPHASQNQAFNEIEPTASAAALTSIITSAQVAEKVVEASPVMGKLHICVIVKCAHPDNGTKQIVLYNSIGGIGDAVRDGEDDQLQEAPDRNPELDGRILSEVEIPATNNQRQRSSRLDIAALVDVDEGSQPARRFERRRGTVGVDVARMVASQPATFSTTPATNSPSIFVIPQDTASTVASKILAGSGYYTHVSENVQEWPKSYGELYCKHISVLLQRIYETEKSLSGNPSMRYENLLPDDLLQKLVTIGGIDKCTRQEKGRIPENDTFIVDLSHRRGTQKHVAFAAICIAYSRVHRNPGRMHAAKAVLDVYEKEGESELGCNRFRERGANITVNLCNRSSQGSCLQTTAQHDNGMQHNHISLLKGVEGVKKTVGLGIADLSSDELNENPVPDGMLIINVLKSLPDIPDVLPGESLLWKKEDLSRVDVLFNFKRPIGNAILISSAKSRNEDTLLECQEGESLPVVASYHGTDPSKAAVICDFRLNENMRDASQIRYPYAEWYRMNQYRGLADVHFRNGNGFSGVPRLISAKSVRKFRALLWHKDWISVPRTEEHGDFSETGGNLESSR